MPLSQQLDEKITLLTGQLFSGSQPGFALTEKLPTRLKTCSGGISFKAEIGHDSTGILTLLVSAPMRFAWIFRGTDRCLLHMSGEN